MKIKSFPHLNIEVKDESVTFPFIPEELALHRPMILSFGEKGLAGDKYIYYGSYDELKPQVGEGTFDPYSKWFQHPNLFMRKALQYEKVFFVRLTPADAKTGGLVIWLEEYEDSGNVYLKWNKGSLTDVKTAVADETITYKTIPTWTVTESIGGNSVTGTAYPIFGFDAGSPGEWANTAGITFFYDIDNADHDKELASDAVLYSAGFVDQPYGYDAPLPIRNIFNDKFFDFAFNPDAMDPNTRKRYSWDDVMKDEFRKGIPFSVYTYSNNIKIIGNAIVTAEADPDLTDPWLINLVTLKKNDDTTTYAKTSFLDDSLTLDSNVNEYLLEGNDGDISLANLESLTKDWLSGAIYPDIEDQARYPITHLYDSGYGMDTKLALIDFLGVRDDVKIVASTQVSSEVANSKAEDQSAGSALRSQALLHPESFVYGTGACRVSIFQQCGKLPDSPWKYWVPASYDNLIKRSMFHNAIYIKGVPKGRPNSEVTCFQTVNWTPSNEDHKQLSWDTGLNYFQYADMTTLFYPDLRSVYMYDTSLLSSDIFVDYIVYMKHICLQIWTKYSGVEDPLPTLIASVKNDIDRKMHDVFGNYVQVTSNPYQTELDKQLGYSLTIELLIGGYMPMRVFNVIFRVRRAATGK